MKKAKTLFSVLMVLVFTMSCLSACGDKNEKTGAENTIQPTGTNTPDKTPEITKETKKETKKIALKVWGPQEEQTAYEGYGNSLLAYMCEQFDEAHPEWEITFTYGTVSEGDAKNELTKDSEAAADVFMFASDQTATLVETGILAPITLYQEDVTQINGGKDAASISTATYDNLLYAVPFTPNTWFMYYDKSKYTEEEVANLDTMMAKELGKGVYNFAMDTDSGWYSAAFFFAGGCTLFGENGDNPNDCTFNNENGVKVGNYYSDLVTSNKFLKETDNGANAIAAFKDGKLGAWCSGTWQAESVKKALGDNYAAVKLPTITIDGKESQLKSFADYKYIGVNINTDAESMEAAQALAAYLGGEKCQLIRFKARSIAPTVVSLATNPEVTSNIAVAAVTSQIKHTQFQSTISQMDNFWEPAKAFGAGCYNKEITKDNMQEELDKMVTNILTTIKK